MSQITMSSTYESNYYGSSQTTMEYISQITMSSTYESNYYVVHIVKHSSTVKLN